MSERKITRHYKNGEIDILWEPAKCIHSGICVKELPNVYHPKEHPWVKPENATTEQLVKQINDCPSGALSYTYINSQNTENMENNATENSTTIKVTKDGPLLVEGGFTLEKEDGSKETIDKNTALCRCGASENKPYCDGSHVKVGFKS